VWTMEGRAASMEPQIVVAITQAYPDLTSAELSVAIQAGTEAAERRLRFNSLRQEAKETRASYQKALAHQRDRRRASDPRRP
jgi:hypothetical protein